MKVAINGFGRIGRAVFKIALDKKINIVSINDIQGVEKAVYFLNHDSVFGHYKRKVSSSGNYLIVDKKKFLVLKERDPEKLPWKKLKVDVVVEATGAFRDRNSVMKHIKAGAKKVIITSPAKDSDITIVPGVNSKSLKKSDKIISVASCTTNCAATMLKVINDNFKIKRSILTTIHAYTATQSLVDSESSDNRRGRAAALNIVPTTTGATEAVTLALPELKGKITGLSVRVPVPDGSLIDIVAEIQKHATKEKVNSVFKKASKTTMKNIIEYSNDDLVSTDIIGNSHSSVFDSKLTEIEGNLIKVLAWYDNEYGYSNRVVDVIKMLK